MNLDELQKITEEVLGLRQQIERMWETEKAKGPVTTDNYLYRRAILNLRKEVQSALDTINNMLAGR